jgi:hypothetical protein
MKESVYRKLETLVERYEEVQALLSDPSVISDQNRFRALSKEYSELEEIVKTFLAYQQAQDDVATAEEMLKDSDPDMREMAQEEYKEAKAQILSLEDELQVLMLPKDPKDNNNVFLEVRAGTGGDEAAIFAGDLFRMYSRYDSKIAASSPPVPARTSKNTLLLSLGSLGSISTCSSSSNDKICALASLYSSCAISRISGSESFNISSAVATSSCACWYAKNVFTISSSSEYSFERARKRF